MPPKRRGGTRSTRGGKSKPADSLPIDPVLLNDVSANPTTTTTSTTGSGSDRLSWENDVWERLLLEGLLTVEAMKSKSDNGWRKAGWVSAILYIKARASEAGDDSTQANSFTVDKCKSFYQRVRFNVCSLNRSSLFELYYRGKHNILSSSLSKKELGWDGMKREI